MAIRLDKFLTQSYKQYSRNKLNQFVTTGYVFVNGVKETTPSYLVKDTDKVELKVPSDIWVSRGAYKLLKALEEYKIDLNNEVCLDIGCSTGGFTHVMLKHGAKKVYAVDVGTNQFDKSLLSDKVVLLEQTHFCKTKSNDFEHIDFIACDVSFISAKKIIEHVVKLFNYPFTFVCLIKPQFELTKEILDKCKGIIPEKYHNQAISSVCNCATKLGLQVSNVVASPITGAKSNNTEFLVCLRRV
ncbi:MAG: TlyA family RNA methyltransferase [Mycoplasmoidaceae bacterium]